MKLREHFQTLLRTPGLKIERIVSQGQATPAGKWLVSPRAEWVMVLRGAARLRFKKGGRVVRMKAGDHVLIPTKAAHRVEWTTRQRRTVWLAVHFSGSPRRK